MLPSEMGSDAIPPYGNAKEPSERPGNFASLLKLIRRILGTSIYWRRSLAVPSTVISCVRTFFFPNTPQSNIAVDVQLRFYA